MISRRQLFALSLSPPQSDGVEDPALAEKYLKQNISLQKYKEQLKVLRRRYISLAHKVSDC